MVEQVGQKNHFITSGLPLASFNKESHLLTNKVLPERDSGYMRNKITTTPKVSVFLLYPNVKYMFSVEGYLRKIVDVLEIPLSKCGSFLTTLKFINKVRSNSNKDWSILLTTQILMFKKLGYRNALKTKRQIAHIP